MSQGENREEVPKSRNPLMSNHCNLLNMKGASQSRKNDFPVAPFIYASINIKNQM